MQSGNSRKARNRARLRRVREERATCCCSASTDAPPGISWSSWSRCTSSCLSTASTWPPRRPVMQKDLGLSNIALGLAFSAFNYAYAPFQLVGGWFADRFGARRTLTVCGLVWSLTTIATGAVTGLVSLFGVRWCSAWARALPCRRPPVRSRNGPRSRRAARRSGPPTPPGASGAGTAAPIVALLITWFSWRFSFVAVGILSAFGRPCGGGISTKTRASIRAFPAPNSAALPTLIPQPWPVPARCRGGA